MPAIATSINPDSIYTDTDNSYSLLSLNPSNISPYLYSLSTNPFYVAYYDKERNLMVNAGLTTGSEIKVTDFNSRYAIYDGILYAFTANNVGIAPIPSNNVVDGYYPSILATNSNNSLPPSMVADFTLYTPKQNISTLSFTGNMRGQFGLTDVTSPTKNYFIYFSTTEIYYIDRDGREVVLLSSTHPNSLLKLNINVDIYSYVDSIHVRFSDIQRESFDAFTYRANHSYYFVPRLALRIDSDIDIGYAPPDEDIPLQIWSQILKILEYLQNPMQVTLESILQAIKDGGSATGAVTVIVQQINNTVTNIANTVNNVLQALTPDPSQGDDANVFESAIGGLSDAVESDASALESLSPRPSPSDVVSTISPDIISPSDPDVKRGISVFSDVMSSPLVMPVLIVVFTLATVRFILFGKRV